MCFGWLVKRPLHPEHSKRILMLNWRKKDFIPAFTQWTIVNKKPLKESNSPQAHSLALNLPEKTKKHTLCAKAVFVKNTE